MILWSALQLGRALSLAAKPSFVRRTALPFGVWQVNRSLQWAVGGIFPAETLKLAVLPIQ